MKICPDCGGTCTECLEEHRGSRPEMDSTFADAAFRKFEPVSEGEKEAMREKESHGGTR